MRRQRFHGLLGILLFTALLLAARADAQVDCSDPDNLCTGDPCAMPPLTVVSPCVADFGSRTLVVAGRLTVPADGQLSLSAGRIEVQAAVAGQRAAVTLTATGDIVVARPINVRGSPNGGALTLDAGGDLVVDAPLNVSGGTNASPMSPGPLTLTAGNDVTVTKRLKAAGHSFGSVSITAGGDIELSGPLLPQTRTLGTVSVTAGGNVTVTGAVRGAFQCCSTFTVDAAGALSLNGPFVVRNSHVALRGATGVAATTTFILLSNAIGSEGGGDLELSSSAGPVTVGGQIQATSQLEGGAVHVNAFGDATVNAAIVARGNLAHGGQVDITSSNGNASLNNDISASARGPGGDGGRFVMQAAGTAFIHRNIDVSSVQSFGGLVRVEGAVVQVVPGVLVTADAPSFLTDSDGLRFKATGGDLLLDGHFSARATGSGLFAGVIEGSASGDLIAQGTLQAGTGGCIGFAAGGTVFAGAVADNPIGTDCPGS
jgi:hypothetical protein